MKHITTKHVIALESQGQIIHALALPIGETVEYSEAIYSCTEHDEKEELLKRGVHVDVPPDVIPDWVQPQGAHDAYARGARVRFNGQVWENTGHDANVWQPGVFGWSVVP